MKEYYECHITIRIPKLMDNLSKEAIKTVVEQSGWKYSAIDGDPVLGKGVLAYATGHFRGVRPKEEVVSMLHAMANAYKDKGLDVIREKVELVIYDTKAKVLADAG